jgi:hypothetical protein
MQPFRKLTALTELRALYAAPSPLVQKKKAGRLEPGARAIIEACPFALLATADASGRCDVSPRGGDPGFIRALDEHHLIIPDLGGNNLLDSLQNILENPHAGLLFVTPGRDETLRVDGRASITDEPALLALFTEVRRPHTAIVLEIEAVFIHCAKAFRRAKVWSPEAWSALPASPTAVEVLREQLAIPTPVAELTSYVERSYTEELAAERAPRPPDEAKP